MINSHCLISFDPNRHEMDRVYFNPNFDAVDWVEESFKIAPSGGYLCGVFKIVFPSTLLLIDVRYA
jgi:hypothetical protein